MRQGSCEQRMRISKACARQIRRSAADEGADKAGLARLREGVRERPQEQQLFGRLLEAGSMCGDLQHLSTRWNAASQLPKHDNPKTLPKDPSQHHPAGYGTFPPIPHRKNRHWIEHRIEC